MSLSWETIKLFWSSAVLTGNRTNARSERAIRLKEEKEMAEKNSAIIKTATSEMRVADMTAADLECVEKVNALVALAKEANTP